MWNTVSFVLFSVALVADAQVARFMHHATSPWNPRTHKWVKIEPPTASSVENLYRVKIDDIRPSQKEKRVLNGYLFADSVVEIFDIQENKSIERYKWDEKSHKFIVEPLEGRRLFRNKKIETQKLEEILNEKIGNHDNIKIYFRRAPYIETKKKKGKRYDTWDWYILPEHPNLKEATTECEGTEPYRVWFPMQVMVNNDVKQFGRVFVATGAVLFSVKGTGFDKSAEWMQVVKVLGHEVLMRRAVHWHLKHYLGSVSCFYNGFNSNKRFLSIDPVSASYAAQMIEYDEEIETESEMYRKGFYDGLLAAKLKKRLNA